MSSAAVTIKVSTDPITDWSELASAFPTWGVWSSTWSTSQSGPAPRIVAVRPTLTVTVGG